MSNTKNVSNRLLIIDYKEEIVHSELDLELLESMFPGYSDDETMDNYPQIHSINKAKMGWAGESINMKLDNLQTAINVFRSKGCTHIQIVYHEDHIGYYMYGTEITKATPEQFDQIMAEKNKLSKEYLNQKKQKLELELAAINKELKQ